VSKRRKWILWLFLFLILLGLLTTLVPDLDFPAGPNRIAVVRVEGLIDEVDEVVKDIAKYREEAGVRAIVLRIESPGGGVGPSQELYREVRRTIETKPVVASLGGVAASGGYYIAAASNRIVANPGTVTGSIGVIVYFPNLQGLFEKVGYHMLAIKSGKFKDVGNPSREMTAEERELLQGTVQEVHRQFVRDVAKGRNIPEQRVLDIADGRLLTGETAQQLGLIDELGNFQDAVRRAAELGKIEGEPRLIYVKPKKFSFWDLLMGTSLGGQFLNPAGSSGSILRYQMPVLR
jgi:protease-4